MITGSGQAKKAADNLSSANNDLADFEARLLQQHKDKQAQGKSAFTAPVGVQSKLTTAASMRTSLVMNEPPKPPSSGYTLTLNGGKRTVQDVYNDQKKAAKKEYPTNVQTGGYTASGWTTNKVK